VVALIVCGYLGGKYGQRILWSMAGLSVGILGFILIVALPLDMRLGRLIGFYLTLAVPCPFVALLSLISSNIAGYTKKTTVAALYLIAYCVGNIIGEHAASQNEVLPDTLPASNSTHDPLYSLSQTHRTTNFPPLRRSQLPASTDHHPGLLRCMYDRSPLHLVVLSQAEHQEAGDPRAARIYKASQSGVGLSMSTFSGLVALICNS
jgi:hypothetical protein